MFTPSVDCWPSQGSASSSVTEVPLQRVLDKELSFYHEHRSCPTRLHCQRLPLLQLLLCMIGVGSFVSTFPAGAESVQMNEGVHANHPDTHSDTGATFIAQNQSYGATYDGTTTLTPITDATKPANVVQRGQVAGLQPGAEPNTGVLILGGLALLLWIQRFRRNRI